MFSRSHARPRDDMGISHVDTIIVIPVTKRSVPDEIHRCQVNAFHSATSTSSLTCHTTRPIPEMKTDTYFCDNFSCDSFSTFLQSHVVFFLGSFVYMGSSTATSEGIRVLIADSNRMQSQLLISALRRHAEFHISACEMETVSILRSVTEKYPHVALLSISSTVSVGESVVTLRRFHLSHPEIPKVLLIESLDRDLVISAFRSGARGIFSITDASLRLLCKCLLRVAAGQIWASSEQLNYLIDLISEVPSLRVLNSNGERLLTPREEQVVALVAEGLGNRQIARELNLSEHTIKKYLFRIFEKLGVSTRVELVLYAVNNGDPRHAEWLPGAARIPPSA